MAATFITWSALLTSLKNALAEAVSSGAFKAASISHNGKAIQYRTLEELKTTIEWVQTMAAIEDGSAVGRTYAKQGGGGRW